MVTITKHYEISFQGKSWVVPSGFLHASDEEEFYVQVRASCGGLCSLLGCPKNVRNPSLNGSKKLKELLELRNSKLGLLVAKDKIFLEQEQTGSPKKRRKIEAADGDKKLELDLPDGTGSITVKKARLAREDLQVLLQEKHWELLLTFLKSEDIQFQPDSRKYQKTGRYSKKKEATPSESD